MIKHLIFDMGGVILPLQPAEAYRRFESLGILDARVQMGVYGQTGIFRQVETGEISADDFCRAMGQQAYAQARRFPSEEEAVFPFEEVQWAWMGYIQDIPQQRLDNLTRLRADYHVCMLSNTNPFLMAQLDSPAFTAQGKPISDYFDDVFYSYLLHDYKPSATIFQKVLAMGNMQAEECLFLDDGPANIEAAERVNMHGLLVENNEDWMEALLVRLAELNH